MNILVTGGAGFIGSALAKRLVAEGHQVIIVDNFNAYYDIQLKRNRVAELVPNVPVYFLDINNKDALSALFKMYQFDVVCHLAAQAGVRYSVEVPEVYVTTNVLGTQTIFEVMQKHGVKRMVFASTSSAYGTTTPAPFREDESADRPVSVYAATKRSAELLAYNYFAQYGIETTCLRFFTVYGPWSRPDMAMLKFAEKITKGEEIEIYNEGNLRRDFTYIDDIVAGFVKAVEKPLQYEIVNLGNGRPVELMRFVELLEKELGKTAKKVFLPMQQGDVYETYADTNKAQALLGWQAKTTFETGIKNFASWYRSYYK
ncbi:NAD-dependent epimerase/dehydratase family protein [Candidatus Kaiserbacteria bacterium]|nr:NAD-dependent epimerase/dehydratase family protein [Candidatus Kaiserbacteria bacterium]